MPCTFYLLESRSACGGSFATFLEGVFPGLNWADGNLSELAETLAEVAELHLGVYVVYREDLPEGEDLGKVLGVIYGAEPGDTIIEVPSDDGSGQVAIWPIPPTARAEVATE